MDLGAVLEQCIDKSDKIIELIKTKVYGDSSNKKLIKLFPVTQVASLVGVTRETIRLAEKNGKVSPPTVKKGPKKYYSLAEINTLRDFFGTRPGVSKESKGKTLLVMNFKGGVRKTTLALHQAQFLALKGYKVLLVDTDSQASATTMLGYTPDLDIAPEETILPFFKGDKQDLKYCVKKTYFEGLDLIPSCLSLYDVEFGMVIERIEDAKLSEEEKKKKKQREITENKRTIPQTQRLRAGLDTVRADYDFIIIDAPPSMGLMSFSILYAADSIVIPVPPVLQDFCSTRQFFFLLQELQPFLVKQGYDFVKLLISRHDGKVETENFVKLLNSVFPSEMMMKNHFKDTFEVVRASSYLQTVYELEDIKSRPTYNRALDIINNVCSEIEELLLESSKTKLAKGGKREPALW